MKWKVHPSDLSSSAGICPSCLHERLLVVFAAELSEQAQDIDRPRFNSQESSPGSFLLSAQNSDYAGEFGGGARPLCSTRDGPVAVEIEEDKKRKGGRLWSLILGIFGSKSVKPDIVYSHRKKKIRAFPLDKSGSKIGKRQKAYGHTGKRVLPERHSDGANEHSDGGSIGAASELEYSQGWMRTRASTHAKSSSTVSYCLSPLICATAGIRKGLRRR